MSYDDLEKIKDEEEHQRMLTQVYRHKDAKDKVEAMMSSEDKAKAAKIAEERAEHAKKMVNHFKSYILADPIKRALLLRIFRNDLFLIADDEDDEDWSDEDILGTVKWSYQNGSYNCGMWAHLLPEDGPPNGYGIRQGGVGSMDGGVYKIRYDND